MLGITGASPPPHAVGHAVTIGWPVPAAEGHAALMRSMTGYGRGEHLAEGTRVVVELRAVNRRQAEVNLRLPPELEVVETRLREEVLKAVSRGRAEMKVALELPAGTATGRVNTALARAYTLELQALATELGLTGGVTVESLLRCPGVLQGGESDADPEARWALVGPALRTALAAFNAMREREGAALAADLQARITELRGAVARVRERTPEVGRRFREQLLLRIRQAGLENVSADDERVLKEVVFFADRSDINEELARLESHFVQFDDCVRAAEPVGRRLDFLAQEINREVNTIGAKANDARIAVDVVVLKTELERFREQAQNVE